MLARRTPNWIAWVAIAGLTVLAAYCLYAMFANSARPGAYYAYHNHPEAFVYPTQEVAGWSIAIVVETVVACVWLWRSRSPIACCAAFAAIFGVIVFFCLPLVMHAPPYYGCHIAFVVLAALWLGLVAVVGGLARLLAPYFVPSQRMKASYALEELWELHDPPGADRGSDPGEEPA